MTYNYGKMAGAPKGLCRDWPSREVRERERKLTEEHEETTNDFDFDFDDEEEIFAS